MGNFDHILAAKRNPPASTPPPQQAAAPVPQPTYTPPPPPVQTGASPMAFGRTTQQTAAPGLPVLQFDPASVWPLMEQMAEDLDAAFKAACATFNLDAYVGRPNRFEFPQAVLFECWVRPHANDPHLTERVTFVTGEDAGGSDPTRLSRTLGRPFIHKPFELSRLAESLDDAGRRVQP